MPEQKYRCDKCTNWFIPGQCFICLCPICIPKIPTSDTSVEKLLLEELYHIASNLAGCKHKMLQNLYKSVCLCIKQAESRLLEPAVLEFEIRPEFLDCLYLNGHKLLENKSRDVLRTKARDFAKSLGMVEKFKEAGIKPKNT